MSGNEFGSDRTRVDANFKDLPDYQMNRLGLLGTTSPDFERDPETTSTCLLLTPSPGGEDQNGDPLSQALEQKLLLTGKSPSPDYNQDEETALLAASPAASYNHPLDPLRGLSLESANPPEVSYTEFQLSKPDQVAGNLTENFHHRTRNSFPGDTLESGSSTAGFALQKNIAGAPLLGNRYQQLENTDNVPFQENVIKASPLDFGSCKTAPDYDFLTWNWPLIRKSCFYTIASSLLACFCILVGSLATVPRRCYPPHTWYQGTVFYEIFPASFQDSDRDGIGDLRGLGSRADYISKLGIRAVRLNSIFPASHYPEGFGKVTSLTEIEKSIGTFQDFEYFIGAMNARNISVVLDFPVHPYVKNLGELRVSHSKKNIAEKIANVVHNHRSHRAVREPTKTDLLNGAEYLKPYIDGGIAGLMKSTSDHLNAISQTILEEAIEFWFKKGVDGIYLKGLEYYLTDPKFVVELKKWKEIKKKFRGPGKEKMLMCEYKVLTRVGDEETLDAILDTIDLLDVYLDVSNGTSHIQSEVNRYQRGRLLDKRTYPWIHWNIGNVDTKRLAGRVENNFGAILFQFLLPGTVSIFYGDEIGLTEIHDPHFDHRDVRYIHQLAPMKWQPNGTGFTRPDALPWLPFAKSVRTNDIHEKILSDMSALRNAAPSIYMNSIWKDQESLSNSAFRFVDENILVLERTYPRRNAYVVVYNAGTDEANNDLSRFYYRGELLQDSRGRNGVFMNFNNLKLGSGEAFVVKLDK